MSILSKVKKVIKDPKKLIKYFKRKKLRSKNLNDKIFLQEYFKLEMGYELDLDNPQTFNEKLQWLKLYDRKPIYTTMVDKYAAKKYVADIIGEEYIIPTLGVWDSFDDIDFDSLPNQFVLKTTHGAGGCNMSICKDKQTFDKKQAKKVLENSLKIDTFAYGREWPYKNVPKRIIAEKYMEDSETKELRDYKFFCFNGEVDSVMVCLDRHIGDTKFYFFDEKWSLKRYNKRGINAPEGFTISKPKNLEKMFEIAKILSTNTPFLRVDLYEVNGQIYFGELTLYPTSGFDANLLRQTDEYFGQLINLEKVNENNRISD